MKKYLVLVAGIVASDQLTKYLAATHLVRGSVELAPFLNLTLVHNTGAAFGFLNDAAGWQNFFFVAIATIACIVIVFMLKRMSPRDVLVGTGLALILAGALGNLIDRLIYGYVIDFIDFYYGSWHWPAFNVADSAITIGAVILVFDAFGLGRQKAETLNGDRPKTGV